MRRDLVAQLDSLRLRNSALFEGGGESLRMESLLGLGKYQRPNRTRLSIIYTGFLGDNENILFWVSQFLSEALRFCQRNPNDELQAVVMFDEADLYIPANSKPATAEPLQSLLKRARSAGLGMMLATQSPGDLDYKSRDQITSWFIGRVREDTALRKLKAAFQSESGLDPATALPGQTVGEFHLVQEGLVRADEGADVADLGRTGAVRPHRATGRRNARPGRAPAAPVRPQVTSQADARLAADLHVRIQAHADQFMFQICVIRMYCVQRSSRCGNHSYMPGALQIKPFD